MIEFENLPQELSCEKVLLKQWLKRIIRNEGFEPGDIHYTFYKDAELVEVNFKFLNHDTYTDIITFDYCNGGIVAGEIFVSEERIRDNAVMLQEVLHNEMLRVVAHGVLHLCGYKDKTDEDAALMREKETAAISLFNSIK